MKAPPVGRWTAADAARLDAQARKAAAACQNAVAFPTLQAWRAHARPAGCSASAAAALDVICAALRELDLPLETPFGLNVEVLAVQAGLSAARARAALLELERLGQIVLAEPARGRRPATYTVRVAPRSQGCGGSGDPPFAA